MITVSPRMTRKAGQVLIYGELDRRLNGFLSFLREASDHGYRPKYSTLLFVDMCTCIQGVFLPTMYSWISINLLFPAYLKKVGYTCSYLTRLL